MNQGNLGYEALFAYWDMNKIVAHIPPMLSTESCAFLNYRWQLCYYPSITDEETEIQKT